MDIEIYDMYDLWYVPAWWEKKISWLYIAGICVTVLVASALCFFWRKKSTVKETKRQKALKMLAILETQKNLLTHQELYAKVTGFMKEIFYGCYGSLFKGKTDAEFLAALKEVSLDHEIQQVLKDIFKGVELIKFAHEKTLIAKRDEDLVRCRFVIEKMYPKESRF